MATAPSQRRREPDPVFEYDGSTFNEVKEVTWSGPYSEPLPVLTGLTPGKFVEFFNHSTRNLIDRRDILPYFEKLIHTNGICFTGTWRIDTETPYTGYFAEGSEGLLLVRGSVAGPAIMAGDRRAFGWGGKIWPTLDPDEKFKPANWVTVSKLSGSRRQHILDYLPTNKPKVGRDPGANLVNRGIFRLLDTRPGWRQVHPISTLGVKRDESVVTPDLLMIRVAPGTPRADYADFRDELRLENYPGNKLVFTINVKNFDQAEWARIGEMELTDYAISEGGDRRLHFWIPRDVPSPRWDSGA